MRREVGDGAVDGASGRGLGLGLGAAVVVVVAAFLFLLSLLEGVWGG